MFHTYIKNAQGVDIDIDRARFLADDDLWNDAVDRCKAGGSVEAQAVWDAYCALHLDHYETPFPPHVAKEPL